MEESEQSSNLENSILQDAEIELLDFEMKQIFDNYHVEYPSDDEIKATIKVIRNSIPVNEKKTDVICKKSFSLLKNSLREFNHISSVFWISNISFFIFGLIMIFLGRFNPYLTVMFLSPIPFVLGLIEVFKSRDRGIAELEMTLKHSYQQIVLSRMVVVGCYNLVLNVSITVILSLFMKEVWIWKLIFYWSTPFTVVSVMTLIIESRIRNSYTTASVSIGIWLTFTSCLILFEQTIEWFENIDVVYFIILNFLAITILINLVIRKGGHFAFSSRTFIEKVWR